MEPGLYDPSADNDPPKWFSIFTNLVLLDRGCELFTELSMAVAFSTWSSISDILKEAELHNFVYINKM